MVTSRNPSDVFGTPQASLNLFTVRGPLHLFVVQPLSDLAGDLEDPDAGERALVLSDVGQLIHETGHAVARGAISTPDDNFFVVVLGKQVAWFQGGVPEPGNFDTLAGHYEDQFPQISSWLEDPRRAGDRPHQLPPVKTGSSSWDGASPQWRSADDRDNSREDPRIPSFKPYARIATPPEIVWVEIDDLEEKKSQAGVCVFRRAADHDLGELVAQVENLGWRGQKGRSKTRVFVLPVTSGKATASGWIFPTRQQAGEIRWVVGEWSRDGAGVADFNGFIFDERE